MLAPLRRPIGDTEGLPLVVDLDGTLIRSDLLVETFFAHLGGTPEGLLALAGAARRGKAAIKHHLAAASVDIARLPYDEAVLARIAEARADGRPVFLASASNEALVRRVAAHLGVFDGWFASSAMENLNGATKAARLVATFGEHGFDYVGNHAADLAVWVHANRALAVRLAPTARRRLLAMAPDAEFLDAPPAGALATARTWFKLLRVHQWAKNALVFVPLLMGQRFNLDALGSALLAFLAFSLCASSVYLVNDLVDVEADRAHPTKCRRGLASGQVSGLAAMAAAPTLLAAALAVASLVSWAFAGVLLAYVALTGAYSFSLKRKMLVDVVTLAGLYTIRVVGAASPSAQRRRTGCSASRCSCSWRWRSSSATPSSPRASTAGCRARRTATTRWRTCRSSRRSPRRRATTRSSCSRSTCRPMR